MEIHNEVFVVFSWVMAFTFVFGVLLNGVVCVTLLKYRSLLTEVNILILSMAISDLISSAVPASFSMVANIEKRWIFKDWGCDGTGFLANLTGGVSITHLAAVAYDRYETFGLKKTKKIFLTDTRIKYIAIFLWLFSFVFAIAPVLGWSNYKLEGVGTSCAIHWTSTEITSISYTVTIFVGYFFVPLSVIFFSYHKVYISLKEMKNNADNLWGKMSDMAKKTAKLEQKMTIILFIMSLGFILAWSPYAVVSLISAFRGTEWIEKTAASVPAIIAKSSSLYNPIVYFLMYKRFRKKAKQLFKTCFRLKENSENSVHLKHCGKVI